MSIQPGGGGNRNLKNLPYDAQGLREWSFEILDCCGDSETCLAALLCPCVMHSANEKRHQYLETHGTYDPEHGGPWCSENCWDYVVKMGVAIFVGCCTGGLACCCRMPCLTQISPRQRLRARYNIVGTPSTDCTAAILCSSCALTQESRELELEEMSLGWTRPVPATQISTQPSAFMHTQVVSMPPTMTMMMAVPQSTVPVGVVGNEKRTTQAIQV
ncbi:PLAC8-domain-containing protein [Pluteus cervinus]|uniref:PLAC8-domain-containing protein n=1 Tax=Pluteus cervinus TaxID=181527 RepID=A0ACD3A1G7_9AGAR|nr:PLAC8-domain-containing protein [Pluteus cervinus]